MLNLGCLAIDAFLIGDDDTIVQVLINHLNDLFALKYLGNLSYILSIEVHSSEFGMHLTQHKYVPDILFIIGLLDSKASSSLMASRKGLSKLDGVLLDDPIQCRSMVWGLTIPYHYIA